MRLALALILTAAPAFADPLASKAACEAFAASLQNADPVLAFIDFSEGRVAHNLHTEDAKMASDVLDARALGGDMPAEAVAVYVNRVCRSL